MSLPAVCLGITSIYEKKTTISTQLMFSESPKKLEKICRPQKVHRHRWWQKPVLPPLHGHLSPKSGVTKQPKKRETNLDVKVDLNVAVVVVVGVVVSVFSKVLFHAICYCLSCIRITQALKNQPTSITSSNHQFLFFLLKKNGFSMFPMRNLPSDCSGSYTSPPEHDPECSSLWWQCWLKCPHVSNETSRGEPSHQHRQSTFVVISNGYGGWTNPFEKYEWNWIQKPTDPGEN